MPGHVKEEDERLPTILQDQAMDPLTSLALLRQHLSELHQTKQQVFIYARKLDNEDALLHELVIEKAHLSDERQRLVRRLVEIEADLQEIESNTKILQTSRSQSVQSLSSSKQSFNSLKETIDTLRAHHNIPTNIPSIEQELEEERLRQVEERRQRWLESGLADGLTKSERERENKTREAWEEKKEKEKAKGKTAAASGGGSRATKTTSTRTSAQLPVDESTTGKRKRGRPPKSRSDITSSSSFMQNSADLVGESKGAISTEIPSIKLKLNISNTTNVMQEGFEGRRSKRKR